MCLSCQVNAMKSYEDTQEAHGEFGALEIRFGVEIQNLSRVAPGAAGRAGQGGVGGAPAPLRLPPLAPGPHGAPHVSQRQCLSAPFLSRPVLRGADADVRTGTACIPWGRGVSLGDWLTSALPAESQNLAATPCPSAPHQPRVPAARAGLVVKHTTQATYLQTCPHQSQSLRSDPHTHTHTRVHSRSDAHAHTHRYTTSTHMLRPACS